MSIRSNIGIINRDGTVETIYCHRDGYPEYTGKLLLGHYNREADARAIVKLGALLYLDKLLVPFLIDYHSFDKPAKDVTVAYFRDRGDIERTSVFIDIADAVENFDENCISYLYLWDCANMCWIYSECKHKDVFHVLGWKRCTPKNRENVHDPIPGPSSVVTPVKSAVKKILVEDTFNENEPIVQNAMSGSYSKRVGYSPRSKVENDNAVVGIRYHLNSMKRFIENKFVEIDKLIAKIK